MVNTCTTDAQPSLAVLAALAIQLGHPCRRGRVGSCLRLRQSPSRWPRRSGCGCHKRTRDDGQEDEWPLGVLFHNRVRHAVAVHRDRAVEVRAIDRDTPIGQSTQHDS